jgi:predicted nucleic acid-binding protein
MSRIVLLDTGPLGKIVNPRKFPEINQWLQRLTDGGEEVLIPEIADYELRRGLLRLSDAAGIERLDQLATILGYVPLSTEAMRRAAHFWAEARRRGSATAPDPALDGDVILAAQAVTMGSNTVIATGNVRDLGRYASASHWNTIT